MRTSYWADVLRLKFHRESAVDLECRTNCQAEHVCVINSALPTEQTARVFFLLSHSVITSLPFTDISLWYLVGGMSSQT